MASLEEKYDHNYILGNNRFLGKCSNFLISVLIISLIISGVQLGRNFAGSRQTRPSSVWFLCRSLQASGATRKPEAPVTHQAALVLCQGKTCESHLALRWFPWSKHPPGRWMRSSRGWSGFRGPSAKPAAAAGPSSQGAFIIKMVLSHSASGTA